MDKDFLTVPDIAKELDITERTVRKLINTGEIPCKKVAGKYIITRDKLKNYINS